MSNDKCLKNLGFKPAKLIKISVFISQFFDEDSKPSRNTVFKWLEEAIIDGRRIGDLTFIVINDKFKSLFSEEHPTPCPSYKQRSETHTGLPSAIIEADDPVLAEIYAKVKKSSSQSIRLT